MTTKQWENAYRCKVEDYDELLKENAKLKVCAERLYEANDRLIIENTALRAEIERIMMECHDQNIWNIGRSVLTRKEAQP